MSDAPATKKRRSTRTTGETPAAPKRQRTAAKPARANGATASAPAAVPSAVIAARAYERFAARGYVHGHDLEDWVVAERELVDGARA